MTRHKKTNIKSIRYSDRFREIVEGFEGNSFNEKLENLVLYCHDAVPEVEKKLAYIKSDIEAEYEKLLEVQSKMRDMNQLLNTIKQLQFYGEQAAKKAEAMAGEFNK